MAQLEIIALSTAASQLMAPQSGDSYIANRDLSVQANLESNSFRLTSSAVVTDATASRTLTAADNGKVIYFTSSSAVTITTATGLGAGFSCSFIQGGTGQLTLSQGSGTTLVSYSSLLKSAGQYAMISAVSPVSNTFVAVGQLTA